MIRKLKSSKWRLYSRKVSPKTGKRRYKVPMRVHPLAEVPVTPGAYATKVQRTNLREVARELTAE